MSNPPEGYAALTFHAGFHVDGHIGQFEVSDIDANACINRVVTADLSLLGAGHGVATLLLNDDGSIQARLMLYRFPDRILLTTAATTRTTVWDELIVHKRGQVRMRDISAETALVQVRGPESATMLSRGMMSPLPKEPGTIVNSRIGEISLFAARALAEGPDGFDLHCRGRDLDALMVKLHDIGMAHISAEVWEIARIEWGVSNVGVEIHDTDTPVEAALEDLVKEGKGAPFPGEFAVAARRRSGAMRRLVGVRIDGQVLPPSGAEIRVAALEGEKLRSVARSPRAGVIATVSVPASATAVGTPVTITADGQQWHGTVARRPFVARGVS